MDMQVDSGRVILVVLVTFAVVVIFNVLLYFSAISKNTTGQVNKLRSAARGFRNPWQAEDDQLKKLSEMVASLKDGAGQEHKHDDTNE